MFEGSIAERCPGETDCEKFQIAAEPKTDACALCPLRETKPVKIEALTSLDRAEIEAHVDRIADLAAQQAAGFPIRSDEICPLDFELLKMWHTTAGIYERAQRNAQQAQMQAFLKALLR